MFFLYWSGCETPVEVKQSHSLGVVNKQTMNNQINSGVLLRFSFFRDWNHWKSLHWTRLSVWTWKCRCLRLWHVWYVCFHTFARRDYKHRKFSDCVSVWVCWLRWIAMNSYFFFLLNFFSSPFYFKFLSTYSIEIGNKTVAAISSRKHRFPSDQL